jgi:probable F420-dependent oxidoreductase
MVAAMQIGFGIPVSGSWATPSIIREVSQRAEALGYSSLWTFQRVLVKRNGDQLELPSQYHSVLDPLATMAYVAGLTERVRIGVGIVNMPYFAPAILAKSLATIDVLSNGRLDAGLGIGWSPDEFEAAGIPYEKRGARAEDYLRALRAIWTQDTVEYDGPFYKVPRSLIEPKPVQRPHPPILLGASAPVAMKRVGREADGWIASSRTDVTQLGASIKIMRDAATEAGRDPSKLRFIVRGVVRVRANERAPLVGTFDQIRGDLADIAAQGVTETFIDLNFDTEIGSRTADPELSLRRAHQALEALAPGA